MGGFALCTISACGAATNEPIVVTPGTTFSHGAAAPADAIVLFDGKDLSAWNGPEGKPPGWMVENGYAVVRGGEPIGVVTSGTQTPYLKKAIGMAYVPIDLSTPGIDIEIDVRGRAAQARVVPMPFYKRAK